jgi:microcystin-dependent protein
MSDQFVGQILLFPFNFAPVGFAMCQGQLIAISQNTALFSLLGTTYGGNGTSTFALPDLRGRAPMGYGQGPGLSSRSIGAAIGTESETLATTQAAAHAHALDVSGLSASMRCLSGTADRGTPVTDVPATEAPSVPATYSLSAPDAAMAAGAVVVSGSLSATAAGGGQAHDNRQPYLTMNYCIALTGVYPPRT